MQSIRQLFRIGTGPSSSHTLAPREAAHRFREKYPDADSFRIVLYGSLAATAQGHLTVQAVTEPFGNTRTETELRPDTVLPFHPNAMQFEARDTHKGVTGTWLVFSTGGGELREEGESPPESVYPQSTFDEIISRMENEGKPLWMYVREHEDRAITPFLESVYRAMKHTVSSGLDTEGVLPGELRLQRKAHQVYSQVKNLAPEMKRTGLLSSYALASAEENASGRTVVTAPTCGSCGVVPAILRYLGETRECSNGDIINALAVAGLTGTVIKHNASVSGAEVGCQGEIGAACSMAAAAAAQLLGGSPFQIEYAAEMALEHHLGLTCDPVGGYVQIPCIERNAMAATRALDCAEYALLSDGRHRISFDQVVLTMKQTGHDLPSLYRETGRGGLASTFRETHRN